MRNNGPTGATGWEQDAKKAGGGPSERRANLFMGWGLEFRMNGGSIAMGTYRRRVQSRTISLPLMTSIGLADTRGAAGAGFMGGALFNVLAGMLGARGARWKALGRRFRVRW